MKIKARIKEEAQAETKREAQAETKGEVKVEIKREVQVEIKREVQAEIIRENHKKWKDHNLLQEHFLNLLFLKRNKGQKEIEAGVKKRKIIKKIVEQI